MRYTKCYRSDAAWDDQYGLSGGFKEHNLEGLWRWTGIRCSI